MHFGVCLRGRGWMCHVGTKLVFFSLACSSPFWNVTRVTTIPGQGNKAKLAIQWKTQVRLVVLARHLFDQREPFVSPGGWKPIEKRGSQVQGLPFEGIFFFRCRRSVCSSELLLFFLFAGSIFLYFLLFLINLSYLVGFYFTYLTGYAFSN